MEGSSGYDNAGPLTPVGRVEPENVGNASATEINEDHGLVRQVVGGMVPLRCPDCGGWPCQCLF
jgi:hypothetical protein